jgi:hypothetical protein
MLRFAWRLSTGVGLSVVGKRRDPQFGNGLFQLTHAFQGNATVGHIDRRQSPAVYRRNVFISMVVVRRRAGCNGCVKCREVFCSIGRRTATPATLAVAATLF